MAAPGKIWFNYWDPPYTGKEPSFFPGENFPWVADLENNWNVYEAELKKLIEKKNKSLQPYFTSARDTGSSGWKTISLMTWGIKVPSNLDKCPQLKKLIETYPGWLSASVNLLEPHTSIKEHSGDTNAIFRCHVGMEIPGKLPGCGFRVKEESRSWEKGKALIFLDAHPHTAWNNTSSGRIIFLFDMLRPEFMERKNQVCNRVRSFLLLQLFAERFPLLKKIPKGLQKMLFYGICGILWMLLPYQKKKGVIRKH